MSIPSHRSPLHEETAVVLIDAQASFLGAMAGDSEPLLLRLERLLMLADWLELPTIATLERPVDAKGHLPDRLQVRTPNAIGIHEKSTFDLTREPVITDAVRATRRGTVVVAGGETDVCVLQSVLGLLELGYRVYVLEDCLFSSEPDTEFAVQRMRQAGALPSSFKSFAYELTGTVDRTAWPRAWQDALKERDLFPDPETLPPRG